MKKLFYQPALNSVFFKGSLEKIRKCLTPFKVELYRKATQSTVQHVREAVCGEATILYCKIR